MSRTGSRLFVFGAGGHGKVVADAVLARGLVVEGFLEDDAARAESRCLGLPVRAWRSWLDGLADRSAVSVALGVGDNAARAALFERLKRERIAVVAVAHPAAVLARSATLGDGTVVLAGAIVNAEARIGAGAILNTGSVTEHDVVLGDFVHVSPGAALGGGAQVGAGSLIGTGAVVLPGVRVGARARVGAGAVVNRLVPDGATVVGVPARPLP